MLELTQHNQSVVGLDLIDPNHSMSLGLINGKIRKKKQCAKMADIKMTTIQLLPLIPKKKNNNNKKKTKKQEQQQQQKRFSPLE